MKHLLLLRTILLLPSWARAFTTLSSRTLITLTNKCHLSSSAGSSSVRLSAKKKNRSGQGFAKPSTDTTRTSITSDHDDGPIVASRNEEVFASRSFDEENSRKSQTQQSVRSPEERSQQILREKFGLRSYEEQQADQKEVVLSSQEKKKKQRLGKIEKLWPEEKDLFSLLPPSLLRGIDTFLKVGLAVCTVAFLLAGVCITVEAGYKATGREIPEEFESLVIGVVQPNFTPGLGVLLGFSIGLGLFSAAQLGSKGSVYKEDP